MLNRVEHATPELDPERVRSWRDQISTIRVHDKGRRPLTHCLTAYQLWVETWHECPARECTLRVCQMFLDSGILSCEPPENKRMLRLATHNHAWASLFPGLPAIIALESSLVQRSDELWAILAFSVRLTNRCFESTQFSPLQQQLLIQGIQRTPGEVLRSIGRAHGAEDWTGAGGYRG